MLLPQVNHPAPAPRKLDMQTPLETPGGGAAGKQAVTGIVGADDLMRMFAMQVATLQQQQQQHQHQPPPPKQRQQPPSQPAGDQANKRKTREPSARMQEKADEAPEEGTRVQCKAMCRGGLRCEWYGRVGKGPGWDKPRIDHHSATRKTFDNEKELSK